MLINHVLEKYDDMKQEIKNLDRLRFKDLDSSTNILTYLEKNVIVLCSKRRTNWNYIVISKIRLKKIWVKNLNWKKFKK